MLLDKENKRKLLWYLLDTTELMHIWTQTVTVRTRPVQVLTRQNPSPDQGKRIPSPPLTKKLFAINTYREKKNQFSQMKFQWNYQPYSRAGPMPGVIGQHKMNYMLFVLFWVCLSVCLFGGFVSLSFFILVCLFSFLREWEHEVGGVGRWAGHERSWERERLGSKYEV